MSLEFIIPVLLSSVSHLMGETIIKITESHEEACVMFTALIANPSTGKSQSLALFQKCLRKIENFNNSIKDPDDQLLKSKIVNGKFI